MEAYKTEYLAHHGRLHQKWGVRNGPPYPLDSSVTRGYASKQEHKRPSIEPHEDHQRAHNQGEYKKNVAELSDKDLQSRLNRLRMEQQYSELEDSTISRGKKHVNDTLKIIGTTATTTSAILTIYNNSDKIASIIGKLVKKG